MNTLLDKIDKLLIDQEDSGATTTDNVEEKYPGQDKECPEGEKWWPKRKKCIPV